MVYGQTKLKNLIRKIAEMQNLRTMKMATFRATVKNRNCAQLFSNCAEFAEFEIARK